MRTFWLTVAMFLSFATLTGCMGEFDGNSSDYSPYADPKAVPPGTRTVQLWASEHPALPTLGSVLDGCRAWWPNAVDCVITDQSVATVRITAVTPEDRKPDTDPARASLMNCEADADGLRTLGMSYGYGRIEIFTKCFEAGKDKNGVTVYNTLLATTVVTHEIGHELGLPHVPDTCDGTAIIGKDGRMLCGAAVMNPILDLNRATAPTPVDDDMYQLFAIDAHLPDAAKGCQGVKAKF